MKKKYSFGILIFLSFALITPSSLSISSVNRTVNLSLFNPMIDNQVHDIMVQTHIPSVATAVVRNNTIIWATGYGEQNDLDTIYMVGSVTKTFTATAIFQIYEKGLIQLDDDVNTYLPFSLRHPNYNNTPITIEMLLTHFSGLSKDNDPYIYGMAEDGLSRLGLENPYDWTPYPFWIKEYLTPNGSLYIPEVWTSYQPGSTRYYSNIGYDVLGYILELVTGKPIWEYIQENILDPLEMHSTGYNFTKFDESQLAKPYIYKFDLDPQSTGNKAYPHYNYFGYSSGALRSNAYDLTKFILVHLHKGISNGIRILEEQTIQIMHQMQASWIDGKAGLVDWDGWSGTEGDVYGFHAKAYGIHDGSTTVPYAVITFVNQGMDEGRDACFAITSLLQNYVHEYDAGNLRILILTILTLTISGIGIIFVLGIILKIQLNKRRNNNSSVPF